MATRTGARVSGQSLPRSFIAREAVAMDRPQGAPRRTSSANRCSRRGLSPTRDDAVPGAGGAADAMGPRPRRGWRAPEPQGGDSEAEQDRRPPLRSGHYWRYRARACASASSTSAAIGIGSGWGLSTTTRKELGSRSVVRPRATGLTSRRGPPDDRPLSDPAGHQPRCSAPRDGRRAVVLAALLRPPAGATRRPAPEDQL